MPPANNVDDAAPAAPPPSSAAAAAPPPPAAPPVPQYGQYGQSPSIGALPEVSDPDKAFAEISRNEYLDYVKNYRGFEEELISARNDTSLIDDARVNATNAQGLMQGVAQRNASRYGVNLTPAQLQEQGRGLDRANSLGYAQSVNDARVSQKRINQETIADLINIGQGVNRSSLGQLQGAASSATQRKNAYDAARAQNKASTMSTIGSLGAAAIFAFAF